MPDLPVAVLGAGPVGIDAALALADRGLPFRLYEAGDAVGAHVRDWAHVEMFSPWSMNVSGRMAAALAAAGYEVPAGDACPTGGDLLARLLEPLAALPAIAAGLRLGTRVAAVGREGLLKHEEIASRRRAARPFRLLLSDRDGERVETASLVIDCTGTYGNPNALGDGGIPAPGEAAAAERICHRIPDLGHDGDSWAGRRVLLVGSGHSAQTAARDLADLAARAPGTRIDWLRRGDGEADWGSPEGDALPGRAALAARATALVGGASAAMVAHRGVVEALARDNGQVRVRLRRDDGGPRELVVDRVLALTGGVGDHRLYRQLQVHECYATAAPMKLAAAILGAAGGGDCLASGSHGPQTLTSPEPGFFILGAKSYGRSPGFLLRTGWQQVDEVMSLI
jgi:hypothetical protein